VSCLIKPGGLPGAFFAVAINPVSLQPIEYCGKLASAVSSFIVEAEGCQTNVPTPDMAIGRMLTI